jgi:hypothetical protein
MQPGPFPAGEEEQGQGLPAAIIVASVVRFPFSSPRVKIGGL